MTDQTRPTIANLLSQMAGNWQACLTYIQTLTPDQLTRPTDAAGWTVKDHLTHLAACDDGVFALLESLPRHEFVGVPLALWSGDDFNAVNEFMRQLHHAKTIPEAFEMLTSSHERLVTRITQLQDSDLALPYHHFQPDSDDQEPVLSTLQWVSYHYVEHTVWIKAIVASQ